MTVTPEYIPLIASLSAAVIAGAVAFLVAVLSKELKTSEFRQAWIDGLRTDLAEMVATAQMLAHAATSKAAHGEDHSKVLEFLYSKHADLVVIRTRHNRILLRLNPKEHQALMEASARLANMSPLDATDQGIVAAANTVIDESQKVLKWEWERVKRGEAVFRWTKRVSLATTSVAALVGLVYLIWHLTPTFSP